MPVALKAKSAFNRFLAGCTLFLVLTVVALYVLEHWQTGFINYNLHQTAWFTAIKSLAVFLVALNVLVLVWRLYLFKKYQPIAACPDADLPTITILVPAYNEGEQVLVTLRSVCASDYPADKMQLIAIDDGSQDDTWQWLQKAKIELGRRLDIIRQPKNGGKRHALYTGFQQATGHVWITIDSDSVVEPWGLRNLVSPFVHDAIVGGVGGNVRVLNYRQGLIPKLLEIAFTFGFDFVRATHSKVNTVMCMPGALSAFRASAVRPVMDEWLNETFLGKPYNIGEDRNLTNLVLRQGYHVLFQSNANVYTNVPTTYKGLAKMLLRWARSDVRESLMLNGFAFKNFRPTGKTGARVNLLLSWVDMLVNQPLMLLGVFALLFLPFANLFSLLLFVGLGGLIPASVYFWRHRSLRCLWGVPYALFYFLALSWIQVYANFTVHRSGWLTRQLPMESRGRSGWRLLPMYGLSVVLGFFIISSGSSVNRQMVPDLNGSSLIAMAQPAQAADSPGFNTWWYVAAKDKSQHNGQIQLREVELVINRIDGGQLKLLGQNGVYCPLSNKLLLEGQVQGISEDGLVFVASNGIAFDNATFSLDTDGEVLVKGPALDIRGRGMRFDLADNRAYFLQHEQDINTAPSQNSRVLATLGSGPAN